MLGYDNGVVEWLARPSFTKKHSLRNSHHPVTSIVYSTDETYLLVQDTNNLTIYDVLNKYFQLGRIREMQNLTAYLFL